MKYFKLYFTWVNDIFNYNKLLEQKFRTIKKSLRCLKFEKNIKMQGLPFCKIQLYVYEPFLPWVGLDPPPPSSNHSPITNMCQDPFTLTNHSRRVGLATDQSQPRYLNPHPSSILFTSHSSPIKGMLQYVCCLKALPLLSIL